MAGSYNLRCPNNVSLATMTSYMAVYFKKAVLNVLLPAKKLMCVPLLRNLIDQIESAMIQLPIFSKILLLSRTIGSLEKHAHLRLRGWVRVGFHGDLCG